MKKRFYCKKCGIVEVESIFGCEDDEVSIIVPVFAMSKRAFISHCKREHGIDLKEEGNFKIKYLDLYHSEYDAEDIKEHHVGKFWCWTSID